MNKVKLAWVAGILEGEGCFGLHVYKHSQYINIVCAMTDSDIINRLQEFTGVGLIYTDTTQQTRGYKTAYRWNVAVREDVVNLCTLLKPYMGIRRKTKIVEMLAWHENNPLRCKIARHGSTAMYAEHCRCAACKAAHAASAREYRKACRV